MNVNKINEGITPQNDRGSEEKRAAFPGAKQKVTGTLRQK